jgi:hypothetical protein
MSFFGSMFGRSPASVPLPAAPAAPRYTSPAGELNKLQEIRGVPSNKEIDLAKRLLPVLITQYTYPQTSPRRQEGYAAAMEADRIVSSIDRGSPEYASLLEKMKKMDDLKDENPSDESSSALVAQGYTQLLQYYNSFERTAGRRRKSRHGRKHRKAKTAKRRGRR